MRIAVGVMLAAYVLIFSVWMLRSAAAILAIDGDTLFLLAGRYCC